MGQSWLTILLDLSLYPSFHWILTLFFTVRVIKSANMVWATRRYGTDPDISWSSLRYKNGSYVAALLHLLEILGSTSKESCSSLLKKILPVKFFNNLIRFICRVMNQTADEHEYSWSRRKSQRCILALLRKNNLNSLQQIRQNMAVTLTNDIKLSTMIFLRTLPEKSQD